MEAQRPLDLAAVRAAADVIAPHARRTPNVYSYTFSEGAHCDVWLKLENLQRTGSFKLRGALNKVHALDAEERARGLIAASAGNHAQGVALAARLSGAAATIVMPRATPINKVQRTENYGATVVLHGESFDEAYAHALVLVRERGLVLVHPFDDPDVIAGQGTLGLEVLDEVPDLDAIVLPIGGGGLAAGVALAVKALAPRVRVIGVQASGADAMARSMREGRRVALERTRTFADGIRVGQAGELTFELVRRYVDEVVTVEDAELTEAVVQTMEKSKVVAELAGVAGIAALIHGKVTGAKKVCAVVSGGNIDLNLLARIIESGLSSAGRYHLVRLRVSDVPGQLAQVLAVISEEQGNVLDVQHYRAGWKVPIGFTDIEVLVETRRAGQGARIDAALSARGFEVQS
ncbi:MAG: threonine ammonia-lyase [Planctomycetes bacterium]|nr:threonine ammonia-lyase [Planctomycetota bacterium]